MSFDFFFRVNVNEYEISITPEDFRICKDSNDIFGYSTLIIIPICRNYYKNYYNNNNNFDYEPGKPLYDYDQHLFWILSAWTDDQKLVDYEEDINLSIPF
jgi:hypothetical protein